MKENITMDELLKAHTDADAFLKALVGEKIEERTVEELHAEGWIWYEDVMRNGLGSSQARAKLRIAFENGKSERRRFRIPGKRVPVDFYRAKRTDESSQ